MLCTRSCVCTCKCVYTLWAPAIAKLCYSGLTLVISCPDGIVADTVFAPARGQRLCVSWCVWVCVYVHASCFAVVCLNVLWGKMQDDSKGEERGNRCGAFIKPRETHTYIHTAISSDLLCSCDRPETYCIFVCAFLCTFGRQIPTPFWQTSHCTCMYCTVCMYGCVFNFVVNDSLAVKRKRT